MLRFVILKKIYGEEKLLIEHDITWFAGKIATNCKVYLANLHATKIQEWSAKNIILRGAAPKALFSEEQLAEAITIAIDTVLLEMKKETVAFKPLKTVIQEENNE